MKQEERLMKRKDYLKSWFFRQNKKPETEQQKLKGRLMKPRRKWKRKLKDNKLKKYKNKERQRKKERMKF